MHLEGPRGTAGGGGGERCAFVGERSSHPSPVLPEPAGEATLLVWGTNFFSVLLSVTEERARNLEDAIDPPRF